MIFSWSARPADSLSLSLIQVSKLYSTVHRHDSQTGHTAKNSWTRSRSLRRRIASTAARPFRPPPTSVVASLTQSRGSSAETSVSGSHASALGGTLRPTRRADPVPSPPGITLKKARCIRSETLCHGTIPSLCSAANLLTVARSSRCWAEVADGRAKRKGWSTSPR